MWALNATFKTVSKSFENGTAEKVFSKIAVVGVGTAATVGTVATGSGILGKLSAMTVAQKAVSAIAVARIVAGSTFGITNVIKSQKEKASEQELPAIV